MSYEIQFKEVSIKKVVIEGAATLEEAQRMFNEGDYLNHKVVEIENIEKEIVDAYLLDNE